MKLLLSILAFAAYTDASAQFYNPSLERMNRDIEYRELKQQREDYLALQREALSLQREVLEQQQRLEAIQHQITPNCTRGYVQYGC